MARAITVTGTLAAQEWSTLSAKVAGRLQRLAVDLGSVVREGDLIAQVELRDYELRLQQSAAALAQARAVLGLSLEGEAEQVNVEQISSVKQAWAVLDEAAKNRERVTDLNKTGIASQAELDTVEATYNVSKARYDTAVEEGRTRVAALAQRRAEYNIARKQLEDASVRAPFEGTVQTRTANLGEYLAVGAPIVTLIKTDPLRLRLEVPERGSIAVHAGQTVRLTVEGDSNAYTGLIVRLSPAVTEQNRMLLVEADVPRRGSLRPGLFAKAEIIVNEHEDTVSVPTNAIVVFAGIEKVVTMQDGKAREKNVSTGRTEGGWVEIVSGIAAGEMVVVDPGGLRTGQSVSTNGAAQEHAAPKVAKGSTP